MSFDYSAPCPCNGRRNDCRDNGTGLKHCRALNETETVPGYHWVGLDKQGFNIWAPDDPDYIPDHTKRQSAKKFATEKKTGKPTEPDSVKRHRQVEASKSPATREHKNILARLLGLPWQAADIWPVEVSLDANPCFRFVFPWHDPAGKPIGYSLRPFNDDAFRSRGGSYATGPTKRTYGKTGIAIPVGWSDRDTSKNSPVFLVEGHSDCMAMATLGLNCLGRPNNRNGAEMMADFLARNWELWKGKTLVAVVENDRKEQKFSELSPGMTHGKVGAVSHKPGSVEIPWRPHEDVDENGRLVRSYIWPGREGTEHFASNLAVFLQQKLGRNDFHLVIAEVAGGEKDVRSFVNAKVVEAGGKLSALKLATIGNKFKEDMLANAEVAPHVAIDLGDDTPHSEAGFIRIAGLTCTFTAAELHPTRNLLNEWADQTAEAREQAEGERRRKEEASRAPRCGVGRWLAHLAGEKPDMVIRVRCKCWHCDYCLELNIEKLVRSAATTVGRSKSVYVWSGPASDRFAADKRAKYAGGQRFWMLQPFGQAVLFSNAPFNGAAEEPEPMERFCHAANNIPSGTVRDAQGNPMRRYGTSRKWSVEKNHEQEFYVVNDAHVEDYKYAKQFFEECKVDITLFNPRPKLAEVAGPREGFSFILTASQRAIMLERLQSELPGSVDEELPVPTWGSDVKTPATNPVGNGHPTEWSVYSYSPLETS